MNTRNLLRCIAILMCCFTSAAFARTNTPIETFIRHVKETNTFVPVSNIWQADNNFDKTEMLKKVEQAQPLTIDYAQVADLIKKNSTAISLSVPGADGKIYTIDLAQYSFLSSDFQVHVIGANNSDGVYNYIPGVYYSGIVRGIPGSIASFSFFKNEVYGLFSIPGVGNFNVVPNVMVGKYYDYNTHYVVYNDNDLKIKSLAPNCGADDLRVHEKANSKTTTTLGNETYNNCTQVNVFEVGDYALYSTKGHSVSNVMNYLTSLFNNQSLLYRNEGVPVALKYVQVDSVTDAYQTITGANSSYFLDKFGYETQNVLHGCDLAILASTALNGGYGALGGVAWLQAMCEPYHVYGSGASADTFGAYAFCDMDNSGVTNFPTFSWDVEVITHEMGHVVGSPHTHRCCWNPPGTGTTAIDGCYTLEGSCAMPVPQYPVGGGTIMSYCHLTTDGINLSNGFGPQPGDTVRYYVAHKFSSTCGSHYTPTAAVASARKILSANRECTDIVSGDTTTYYWYDNNTASQADDTLVLSIKKHGNNIGTMDSAGFSVTTATDSAYGTGTGLNISFPSGVTGLLGLNTAMNRYWSINATATPAHAVEVMYPFTATDTADVNGSVNSEHTSTPSLSGYLMYKVNSPVNPDPAFDSFATATAADISLYTFGTTASATNWSLSTSGATNFAHMMMTDLNGGGTGFYSYPPSGIATIAGSNGELYVYPNPTHDQWYISVTRPGSSLTFQLYAADGKLVQSQLLKNSSVNTINATNLPTGVYFYRITGAAIPYTGNLIKK